MYTMVYKSTCIYKIALDGSEMSKELFWMIHGVVWLINGGRIAATYAND